MRIGTFGRDNQTAGDGIGLFCGCCPVSVEQLGRSWGVSRAAEIVEEVFTAVSGWRQEFKDCGVLDEDTARFGEIDGYLQS